MANGGDGGAGEGG